MYPTLLTLLADQASTLNTLRDAFGADAVVQVTADDFSVSITVELPYGAALCDDGDAFFRRHGGGGGRKVRTVSHGRQIYDEREWSANVHNVRVILKERREVVGVGRAAG